MYTLRIDGRRIQTNYTHQDFTCLHYEIIVSHAKVPSPCTLLWVRTILLKSYNTEMKIGLRILASFCQKVSRKRRGPMERAGSGKLRWTSKFQLSTAATRDSTQIDRSMVTKHILKGSSMVISIDDLHLGYVRILFCINRSTICSNPWSFGYGFWLVLIWAGVIYFHVFFL